MASGEYSQLYIPDNVAEAEAYARCSHLAIGAHQDDLEFMAFHGISSCYQNEAQWFGGIVCTDGSGSARSGQFADFTDEEMCLTRMAEQIEAARIGEYSFLQLLGHPSSHAKDRDQRAQMVEEIEAILLRSQPEIIYTHNPADKHSTHIAVLQASLDAIHKLPPYARPKKLYGCEIWRGLDWLCDEDKIALDVSGHKDLASKLHHCFLSQIEGGKNYGEAVVGRSLANATFYDSHSIDSVDRLWYALDLTPLIDDEGPTLESFIKALLERFQQVVIKGLKK